MMKEKIAAALREAEKNRAPMDPIAASNPEFTNDLAYEVQLLNAVHAMGEGRRLVGFKVGLTSKEAQRHFKVSEPDFGHLFADMAVAEEGTLDLGALIQPKIEGEIAFLLGRDLAGPGVTLAEAMRAVDGVVASMEIIDSRIRDWKISSADTIADNGSSARYVLGGRPLPVRQVDLSSVGMALSRNGEVLVTAAGSAVLGNPLNAVVFLANELGKHGRKLEAGHVVLSGSLGGMVPLAAGDTYRCEMSDFGSIVVRASKKESR